MKGIVFNLLEHVAVRTYGDEAWDDVLAAAGVDGAYTSLGSYPDERLFKLVGAASEALDTPPDEVIRWFGRSALPMLADAYPAFFAPHRNTRDFLLTLNDIIHPEVRKLYPGANVPDFDMIATDDGNLTMVYRSERKLCAFAVGLIEGAANHFDERVSVHQPLCMNRGDENCDLEISFN